MKKHLATILLILFISLSFFNLTGCKKEDKEIITGTYMLESIENKHEKLYLDIAGKLTPNDEEKRPYITFGTHKQVYGDDEYWYNRIDEDENEPTIGLYSYVNPVPFDYSWSEDNYIYHDDNTAFRKSNYYILGNQFFFKKDSKLITLSDTWIELTIENDKIKVNYYDKLNKKIVLLFTLVYTKSSDEPRNFVYNY